MVHIVQCSDKNQTELSNLVYPIWESIALSNGYRHHGVTRDKFPISPKFSRWLVIRELMDHIDHGDFIMWVDNDVIPLDSNGRVEMSADQWKYDICLPVSGTLSQSLGGHMTNTLTPMHFSVHIGVFTISVSDIARSFVEHMIASAHAISKTESQHIPYVDEIIATKFVTNTAMRKNVLLIDAHRVIAHHHGDTDRYLFYHAICGDTTEKLSRLRKVINELYNNP